MSQRYGRLTDFLKELSADADVQAARDRVRDAVTEANIDPELKQAILDGDADKINAALARELAAAEHFVLFFL
jgi:hypothetical protein